MRTELQMEQAVKQVHDAKTFLSGLLGKTLGWPIADVGDVEEIAFSWTQADLNAVGLEKNVVEGSVWQLQPGSTDQPWGIFVLEFKHEDALSPRRGMAGVLRKVLRGLVANQRKKGTLPSWRREHLLFICTYNWTHFKFAYFRQKHDQPGSIRLATFGWDPSSKNRTLTEFNLPALAWPDDPKDGERWTKSWAQAFDKEPLTRDFFKRFNEALALIKADLENFQAMSSSEAYTSAQLLLERLIFLYFLQNRGWLDQKRDYLTAALQTHTEPASYSYYHLFLDKLFWTLSTAPSEGGRLSGIPFLNGGLFDDDEFRPPAELRKISPPLKVRNETMRQVFDNFLEAFNFTVKEDTPLSQEVAVDPEMLGKVFESIILHAEAADPDAVAPDKRKDTGSYYTPRIVVHFICREALYQYLLNHLSGEGWGPRLKELLAFDLTDGFDEPTKERLKTTITPEQARDVLGLVEKLKCCDPAVGSGAFPVGLMQELVNLRRLLETALNGYKDPVISKGSQWLHDTKEHIVENCLFGVDIQQQAIEICRLRLWLSLIVDYDIGPDSFKAEKQQFRQAIERMSQLPNLEMNFRRGDSLHDHVCGVPVVILPDRTVRHFEEFKAISKLGDELHQAKKAEKKKRLRVAILEQRLKLSGKLVQEEIERVVRDDSALDGLFGIEESKAKTRERNERELANLKKALASIEKDTRELEKLTRRDADSQFYAKLRKLEGADFNSPFNFAWYIDFPNVFANENGGFDIVVGNPPFVTARNPLKRELWRQRWPRVCQGTYQLVSPFFQLSFELLKPSGELGFIVSNAFWKREFGEPLVTKFFSTVGLQKIVDCSGLSFPGHGTPTCLVFGLNNVVDSDRPVRLVYTQPGGGDLRTIPEESALWETVSKHHNLSESASPLKAGDLGQGFRLVHEDFWIAVGDCLRARVFEHPAAHFFPEWPLTQSIDQKAQGRLLDCLARPIGFNFMTHQDEVFKQPSHVVRNLQLSWPWVRACYPGSMVRNWAAVGMEYIIAPYDDKWNLLDESPAEGFAFLQRFRNALGSRAVFGGGTYTDAGVCWYQYHQVDVTKSRSKHIVVCPEIATHTHAWAVDNGPAWPQTVQVAVLKNSDDVRQSQILAALLNSSLALFWLKQKCFNKGAGAEEQRDRFVYSGTKLQELPLTAELRDALQDKTDKQLLTTFSTLALACSSTSKQVLRLRMRSIFDMAGETYDPIDIGQTECAPTIGSNDPFTNAAGLQHALKSLIMRRNNEVHKMTALQEEMDWSLYCAFGLLPQAYSNARAMINPDPLDRNARPFRLLEEAEGDYERAAALIPADWKQDRKDLWAARLVAIKDNEHIRRIEQAVYKRRWDEQWKVGNQWRCGEIAYAAEFIDAFEWWLKEKAEWWLENKKSGGLAELDEWTAALWADERVQAAWPVAAENYNLLEFDKARAKAEAHGDPIPERPKPRADRATFARHFKAIVEEETVPEGFEFGTEYGELEKKLGKKIPSKLVKVRGKLNVPRERFHSVGKTQYKWAGLQFGK